MLISLNGDKKETLVMDHMAAHEALLDAALAISAATPNARNYQTTSEWSADATLYAEEIKKVQELAQKMLDRAIKIDSL